MHALTASLERPYLIRKRAWHFSEIHMSPRSLCLLENVSISNLLVIILEGHHFTMAPFLQQGHSKYPLKGAI